MCTQFAVGDGPCVGLSPESTPGIAWAELWPNLCLGLSHQDERADNWAPVPGHCIHTDGAFVSLSGTRHAATMPVPSLAAQGQGFAFVETQVGKFLTFTSPWLLSS